MTLIKERTPQEQLKVISQYMPTHPVYQGETMKKILLGLGASWLDYRSVINKLCEEYDVKTTEDLILSWEGFVGIPDSCFGIAGTLDERRKNILLKLSGSNVSTSTQFENVARILGYNVSVASGVDFAVLPATFPILITTQEAAPFTIVVSLDGSLQPPTFPLSFPIELRSGAPEILNCFFDKLKPANTQVVFRYIN